MLIGIGYQLLPLGSGDIGSTDEFMAFVGEQKTGG
jgi:hypothetical protein